MKLTIVTTVLLGLLLTPTLADTDWNTEGNQHSNGNNQYINEQVLSNQVITKKVRIDGGYQTLTLKTQQRIATIQQESIQVSWEILLNYNSGVVATKMLPERVCYISKVNRMELPSFDDLLTLAEESTSVEGESQPERKITFIVNTRIHNLMSYGPDIFALCKGLPTYLAYEVNEPQNPYNQGSCVTFGLLEILGLQYCREFDQKVKQELVSN